jgi:hypothetical protein
MADEGNRLSCCVCGRDVLEGVTLTLTPQERDTFERAGIQPVPPTLSYCKPCHRMLSHRVQGASFLRGVFRVGLRQGGVDSNLADKAAKEMYQTLLKGGPGRRKG